MSRRQSARRQARQNKKRRPIPRVIGSVHCIPTGSIFVSVVGRRRDRVGDRAPPNFVPSSTLSFTSCGPAASGNCRHANFHPVARSTITFKPGKTPVCGSIYIECSTSRPAVMPDGQRPSVVIMDGQSVKTTERGGARGFDAHKRVKRRKRHILVDTLRLMVANRVEPADTSDRRAGALLLGGLSALFPRIRTVIADAGHESRKLAQTLKQDQGWQLRIVKRRQRAFKITGLTWIVERSFAWLGRNRRLSKDYEYWLQTSETMIDLAAIRLMLNRIAPV